MKKFFKWLLISVATFIVILSLGVLILPKAVPQFGASPKGEHLERIQASINYREGKFFNLVETPINGENGSFLKALWKFFQGGQDRSPRDTLQTYPFSKRQFAGESNPLSMVWFGHSTVLLRMGGKNLLIDPIFSEHASPFSFIGPQAFPYSTLYTLDDLPPLDAVLISHDHYDHLDYETILELNSRADKFYVPLGVAAHLMHWGVPEKNITELDWWEEIWFEDSLLFACVPMRHFSGRGPADNYKTLWAGWVIQSGSHSVIHTGDSGYGAHFSEIGEKYGPFDLTMVECGQYNENWPYIHMMPEETVQAHIDMKGKYLLPIHWGRFNLALHPWTDPVVRASAEAKKQNVNLITPVAGQTVTLTPPLPKEQWWLD